MSSERSGKQLILLGPVRFVNSDCEPNCEYDFSSDSGIVQLRVKKRLNPGDEVFVKYGPDFFELNECRCRTCQLRLNEANIQLDVFLEIFLEEIVGEAFLEVHDESQWSNVETPGTECSPPKKRRMRGREMVEQFNDLAESSDSCSENSPEIFSDYEQPLLQASSDSDIDSSQTMNFSNQTEDIETDDSNQSEHSGQEYGTTLFDWDDSDNENVQNVARNVVFVRASSPNSNASSLNCSLSAIDEAAQFFEKNSKTISCTLFDGTETTVHEASSITNLFCSKYNLSEQCSSSLHSLIRSLLPDNNNFPSGYSHLRNIKKQLDENIRVIKKTSENSFCVLNFRFQIRDIFLRNLSQISQYSQRRNRAVFSDFNINLCPVVDISNHQIIVLNLILFSDGVTIKKSTLKKELWPVWIQVADLPPKLRMAKKTLF